MSEKNKDGLRPNVPKFEVPGTNTSEALLYTPEAAARLLEIFHFSPVRQECLAFTYMLDDAKRKELVQFLGAISDLQAGKITTFSQLKAHELALPIKDIRARFSKLLPLLDPFLTRMTDELFAQVDALTPQDSHE